MPPGTSLYDVLSVDRFADQEQIRAAYYAAIKQCHPDIDSGPDAHDMTVALIDAYTVLGDPERRRRYDREFMSWNDSPAHRDTKAAAERSSMPEATSTILFHLWRLAEERRVTDAGPRNNAIERFMRSLRLALWSALTARSRLSNPVIGAAAVTLVLAIITGMMTVVFISQRSALDAAPARASTTGAIVMQNAQFQRTMSPCLDERRGLNAQDLYAHCVQVRATLHNLMLNAHNPAQVEEYKLQDALAEMRQAVGAAELKLSSTPGFVAESVASFADIRKSAKTTRVRRLADIYYHCYALKRCAR